MSLNNAHSASDRFAHDEMAFVAIHGDSEDRRIEEQQLCQIALCTAEILRPDLRDEKKETFVVNLMVLGRSQLHALFEIGKQVGSRVAIL